MNDFCCKEFTKRCLLLEPSPAIKVGLLHCKPISSVNEKNQPMTQITQKLAHIAFIQYIKSKTKPVSHNWKMVKPFQDAAEIKQL
jgi:hypothetical protein